MKIRIEVDETALENEIIIRCAELNKEVQFIQVVSRYYFKPLKEKLEEMRIRR